MAATQNTHIVIGDTTIAVNIKPAYIHELTQLSQETGLPLSTLLNRALDMWVDVEVPVYREYYAKKEGKGR